MSKSEKFITELLKEEDTKELEQPQNSQNLQSDAQKAEVEVVKDGADWVMPAREEQKQAPQEASVEQ